MECFKETEVNIQNWTLKLMSFAIYILKKFINHSVQNAFKNVIKIENIQILFTSDETIKTFSRYKETED